MAAFCPHESGAALPLTSGDDRAHENTIDTMRQWNEHCVKIVKTCSHSPALFQLSHWHWLSFFFMVQVPSWAADHAFRWSGNWWKSTCFGMGRSNFWLWNASTHQLWMSLVWPLVWPGLEGFGQIVWVHCSVSAFRVNFWKCGPLSSIGETRQSISLRNQQATLHISIKVIFDFHTAQHHTHTEEAQHSNLYLQIL